MKKLLTILCLFAVLGLAACNTMEGIGKDTQAAGSALKNAASSNKKY